MKRTIAPLHLPVYFQLFLMSENARGRSASNNTCSICGAPINIDEFDIRAIITKMMKKEHICFSCAFWSDKIKHPVPGREIINGCHYVFHEWLKRPIPFQGSCGQKYYILKNDGSVKRSNNVWFQGEIPDRFKHQLPNTARLITSKAYYTIKSIGCFKCKRKGCWDRYHCYFYDENEEKNGPWNQVPKSHKIGGENCESFLNKNNMYE